MEEEAEHFSDEEAPAAASKATPSTVDGPAKVDEEEEGEDEEQEVEAEAEAEGEGEEGGGGQRKEESKAEEKGNLAGERQSGDGQVRLQILTR